MVLRVAALLPGNGMGIVKTSQTLAILSMQSQRIVQTMRPFG